MDEHFFRRSEQVRADARWLIRRSQELQERQRAWMRRVVATDDDLVLAIAKSRGDRARIEAARQNADAEGGNEAGGVVDR